VTTCTGVSRVLRSYDCLAHFGDRKYCMKNLLRTLTVSTALSLTAFFAGCSASVGVRTYDPYYHDYHVWSDVEVPYYNAWIGETHHPVVAYGRLGRPERQSYWRWRHDHH